MIVGGFSEGWMEILMNSSRRGLHYSLRLYQCSTSSPTRDPAGLDQFCGPFLAPAEGCSLRLHQWGPFGPTKDLWSWIYFENFLRRTAYFYK